MGNQNNPIDLTNQHFSTKPKGCCDKLSLYLPHGKTDPSDITCSICFRIFATPRLMKCKQPLSQSRHKYCQQCIETWGKANTVSCPFCRVEIKRQRGVFGRVDKRTQKKIEKLGLKCRNCCWEGSYLMFLTTFDMQPYLDDGDLPGDNNNCEDNESCQNLMKQEKEEHSHLQKTELKRQQHEQKAQKSQEFKQVVGNEQKEQRKAAFDVFLGSLIGLARSGRLDLSQLG